MGESPAFLLRIRKKKWAGNKKVAIGEKKDIMVKFHIGLQNSCKMIISVPPESYKYVPRIKLRHILNL